METTANGTGKLPPLRIALSKGRGFCESLEYLDIAHSNAFQDFKDGQLPLYYSKELNLLLVKLRSKDIPSLLHQGFIDAAICSSIWFKENTFTSLDSMITLPIQQCRLSLIVNKEKEITDIKTICSKFENITNKYVSQNALPAKVIKMEGSHEAAIFLNMADAIIDVIETGNTIKKLGLIELDCLEMISHGIWVRNHDIQVHKRLNKFLALQPY